MLLDDFKKIVDSYSATIPSNNILQVCQHIGIDTSLGCSKDQVSKKLYDNIKTSLVIKNEEKSETITRVELLKLQSELVYRHVLYSEKSEEYLKILKVINDSCRPNVKYFPSFLETSKWETAIINCKNYNKFSPSTHSILFGKIRDDYPKEFDRATSVKRLVDKGCQIEIKNSEIQNKLPRRRADEVLTGNIFSFAPEGRGIVPIAIKSGLEAVVDALNEKVKTIGGITLAKSLFFHLKQNKKYSKRFERYFITRVPSGISFDQRPQTPFGFLLNLSLKYPFENSKLKNHQTLLDEIIELSIIITNGAYGVQHYNYWEFYFQSGETIIEFCTEIALWDSMFSFPQCRPSTALEITDKLFSFIDDTAFKSALGFGREHLMFIANGIHLITSNQNGPIIIYHSGMCKRLKLIDKNTIQTILDFLSHSQPVNDKYILPSDYSSISFFQKPLIKLANTKFLLMDKSWCSPNYFEAVASKLRTSISDLDSKVGNQLEIFLQNKLTEKRIIFSSGEYKADGIRVDGECDILIESGKAIVLIEFKKKVLTRKSKSGDDINILLDLSDSILSAQLQAGRTEIFLREKGTITLKTKVGKKIIVNLNNRQIERVALTQLEFGGFQDRTIINQFLKSLLTHSFGTYSTDPSIIKKFEKLAKKQKVWVEQYNKLLEIDKGFSHFPYFNCWFLSLPQLLEIINISTDNDSFYETFRKTKHVSRNTLDWYREFDSATKNENEEN